jgi:hypothetical protein
MSVNISEDTSHSDGIHVFFVFEGDCFIPVSTMAGDFWAVLEVLLVGSTVRVMQIP